MPGFGTGAHGHRCEQLDSPVLAAETSGNTDDNAADSILDGAAEMARTSVG